jgi:hypothetical protein
LGAAMLTGSSPVEEIIKNRGYFIKYGKIIKE